MPEQFTREQIEKELEITRGRVRDLEKKIAELESSLDDLKTAEKKWRSIIDNAPNIIMIADRSGAIQFINYTVHGLKVEDIIGKKLYDYIEPEYRELVREATENVFRTGKPGNYCIEGTGPDGGKSWYETYLSPLEINGEITGVILISNDITGRMIAEKALLERESQIRILMDAPKDAIIVIDVKGVICALNDAAAEIIGKSKEEIIGVSGYSLFPKDISENRRKMHEKVIKTAKPAYYEQAYAGRVFDMGVYPVIGPGGVEKLAIVARDITERKKAQESMKFLEEKT